MDRASHDQDTQAMDDDDMLALALAVRFHTIYEQLAPQFGYETRKETREFDPNTPNGKLMVAVCKRILNKDG